MLSDLNYIIFWWLTLLFLGFLSLPLLFVVFKKFWDKAYIFSKILSLVAVSYLSFIFSFLKILPFTNLSIFLIILFLFFLNIFFLSRKNNFFQFKTIFKKHLSAFFLSEALFLLILISWSYVRGFAPDIEGLEKFMDWGFLNSITKTTYMPPQDIWFSGQPINYYYFGHLLFALLTKISGIPSTITYNLSIATICALAFASTFSLSSNLIFIFRKKFDPKKIFIPALFSALLLTFGGNLHAVYKIAKINIQHNGRLILSPAALTLSSNSYWYPDATRFIGADPETNDKTIHEFPAYSFVVADLHGHLNNLPLVMFFMAYLLVSFSSPIKALIPLSRLIPAGFLLSIAFMTNAWDLAVYGLLFAVLICLVNFFQNSPQQALKKIFTSGFLVILFFSLFSLPFVLNFSSMAEGIRLTDARSPFYQLFILHGGFWLINFPFLLIFFRRRHKVSPADLFALALIITATLLIIIPEIVYLKDIYIYEHRRSNTMFKLVYQAFIMYAVVSGYVLFRLKQTLSLYPRSLYLAIFFLVFSSQMIYPYFAINSYYGNLKTYKGLWGLGFMEKAYPDNLKAVHWLNDNLIGQPVVLEAAGDSYTTFNQISAATGFPTVEGWIVHEWLWRGGYDLPAARQTDVAQIYQGQDPAQVESLLQKYAVDYIFVGAKEVEKYPNLNETNFVKLGYPIIVSFGKTHIYKVVK
jgi:uncharacterized membrane protein